MGERRQLLNVAYRLLGSLAEAEDVVQETYARWYDRSEEDRAAIESPGAWLTTVASRICLDLLRSARVRRETYVGEWIPEPVPAGVGSAIPSSTSFFSTVPAMLVSPAAARFVSRAQHEVVRCIRDTWIGLS